VYLSGIGKEPNYFSSVYRVHIREMRATHRVLVEKLVENNHLKDLVLNGKIILKRIFNKILNAVMNHRVS
jgi:hypothetical protein